MKKALSVLLAFISAVSCITYSVSAYADETAYTDYTDREEAYYIETPYGFAVKEITETSVTLEWYAGGYCDGIEICKYNSSNNSYVPVAYADYEDTQCTVTSLEKSKKYVFAARAYVNIDGVLYYSDYTQTVTAATAPASASLKSVKYLSVGCVELKWKKTAAASGYIIKYGTSSKLKEGPSLCTLVVSGADKTKKKISGLGKGKYYFKICAYKSADGNKYCGKFSSVKSVKVKKGASLKAAFNSIKTDNSGAVFVKKYTDGGVDIKKYKSTYAKVKAVYEWHAKNFKSHGWDCVGCNSNFNNCMNAIFSNSSKKYDTFITLAAGNFKNNDGSKVMHKWSVIYLGGKAYIFDPRLQGYTGNSKGTLYFGVKKSSSLAKSFLYEYSFGEWSADMNENTTLSQLVYSKQS